MYKKIALTLIALIFVMVAVCTPALAEPEVDSPANDVSQSQSSSDSNDTSVDQSSNDEQDTSDQTSSEESGEGDESSEEEGENSKTSSTGSRFYIPDDNIYYTESLNSLGGTVTSGSLIIGDESRVSEESQSTSSHSNNEGRFSLQDELKKFLWIPLVVIAICILVLIIFNKLYNIKYKAIDPALKLKAQRKADERRREAARRAAEARRQESEQDDN